MFDTSLLPCRQSFQFPHSKRHQPASTTSRNAYFGYATEVGRKRRWLIQAAQQPGILPPMAIFFHASICARVITLLGSG